MEQAGVPWSELDLAALLSEGFPLGNWKSLVDMEDCLTMDELMLILKAERKKQHEKNRFYALFKGVDLDEEKGDNELSEFQKVRMQADAALAGMSQEQYVFDMIGIDVDVDDDLE